MSQQNELAWEAFRYISGELNHDELVAFETRLATDQLAREAVAEAVELTDATRAALAEPAAPKRSAGSTSRLWYGIAVGVAACLAVMLVIQQVQQPANQVASPNPEQVESSPKGTNDLALRWSELREREETFSPWDAVASDLAASDSAADDDPFDDEDADASTTAPTWMLAAVEQSRKNEDMMDDGPLEQ